MRLITSVAFVVPCCLASMAFAAPANVMNKSITVSTTTTTPWKTADGKTGSGSRVTTQTIYISSAGRIFARMFRQDRGQSKTYNFAPGESTYRFVGDKLVGHVVYMSGASEMIITFDPSGRSCSATLQIGRDNGRPVTWKSNNGITLTATGPSVVSNVSCSIVTGNAFGGQ